MEKKKTVHIISHSHWDREWYMAFEKHRLRLIDLVDDAMEQLDAQDGFEHFHMDGQTIAFDDYLEVKPQNRERIEQYVKEGKLSAGPWYILQDEFLTGSEACVRNLQVGMQEAAAYGKICRIGYFPDAFGNAGQMPQVLKQAGMKAVVFGRGVNPVGFNNMTIEEGDYQSAYSEMRWESPDGSGLLGILFANWYHNGMEIPTDKQEAKAWWTNRLAAAEKFAGTSHLLFMNGCDHQPVQPDLAEAIRVARELFPDITFLHSDFETYAAAVEEELGAEASVVKGELTSQETDGKWTLIHTASSRADLKRENRMCENALVYQAEPLAVMASMIGKRYPEELLLLSWKTLMQNHPHDSICSCSVDEVNAEVKSRFARSRQSTEAIMQDSMKYLADRIVKEEEANAVWEGSKDCFVCREGKIRRSFVVFNTAGWEKSGVVSAVIDWERLAKTWIPDDSKILETHKLPALCLFDENGNKIEATLEDLGVSFGYALPRDRFRMAYAARQVRVTFYAKQIPAFGYQTYVLEEAEDGIVPHGKQTEENVTDASEAVIENGILRVAIAKDGTYQVTDLKNGHTYPVGGWYEDTGDVGNEYLYVQEKSLDTRLTKGLHAVIRVEERSPVRSVVSIKHTLSVPVSCDEQLERERHLCVDFYHREAERSKEETLVTIETTLTLEACANSVKIRTVIHNTAKDHRIRVIVPTGLDAKTHRADAPFELIERANRRKKAWTNPSASDRQLAFVSMTDDKQGMLLANQGIYEYEILPDEQNAIALTLLRCVGEMGDWGVFETPDAQMPGTYCQEYELFVYPAKDEVTMWKEGYKTQASLLWCQPDGLSITRKYPQTACDRIEGGLLHWSGEGLNLTSCKKKNQAEDLMLRFVNNTDHIVELKIEKENWMKQIYQSNVIEEEQKDLTEKEGSVACPVRPFEIITIGIRKNPDRISD